MPDEAAVWHQRVNISLATRGTQGTTYQAEKLVAGRYTVQFQID